ARLLELSLPVSLFYGLLVRRTVDIGFVINRVAVFGLISALVLGVFVLLEYLAGHFVETHGAESWAVQLGIAMTIGVSARFLHGWVDRFVDRVFFAKRHRDESALQRFAQEAEAFTSADTLLDRALRIVNNHTDTLGAAIYLCGDDTATLTRGASPFPEKIDADDPLLVAMRRWNEPVDTHDAPTAFPDGMVFPMSARGRLIGVLACRTKRDATAFAPDEREPLAGVARAAARALDTIGTRPAATGEAIVPILLSLQSAVAGLQQSVEAMQQHITMPREGV
ncbi:MAG TPA: GAF domain-containing protein, partial [Candidatus Baltobacteraceae bacterium]|nr:GAF domain-containing protein [Candidatus Baltobacteraceae bacterium]